MARMPMRKVLVHTLSLTHSSGPYGTRNLKSLSAIVAGHKALHELSQVRHALLADDLLADDLHAGLRSLC